MQKRTSLSFPRETTIERTVPHPSRPLTARTRCRRPGSDTGSEVRAQDRLRQAQGPRARPGGGAGRGRFRQHAGSLA